MTQNDAALWKRWSERRDGSAFEALVAAYAPYVYDFANELLSHKKTECDHDWKAAWAHNDCVKCGAVMFGNSKNDRSDYGVAAGKTFKNMSEAKFYQNHGRLPD